MQGKVTIKITDEGVEFDVKGMQGTSCEELTAALIQDMGEVEEQYLKAEYSQELPDYIHSHEE